MGFEKGVSCEHGLIYGEMDWKRERERMRNE